MKSLLKSADAVDGKPRITRFWKMWSGVLSARTLLSKRDGADDDGEFPAFASNLTYQFLRVHRLGNLASPSSIDPVTTWWDSVNRDYFQEQRIYPAGIRLAQADFSAQVSCLRRIFRR